MVNLPNYKARPRKMRGLIPLLYVLDEQKRRVFRLGKRDELPHTESGVERVEHLVQGVRLAFLLSRQLYPHKFAGTCQECIQPVFLLLLTVLRARNDN